MAADALPEHYNRDGAAMERLRQHDAFASVDYTGTDYTVMEVEVVVDAQIPALPPQPTGGTE
jgi:hypothetical protein